MNQNLLLLMVFISPSLAVAEGDIPLQNQLEPEDIIFQGQGVKSSDPIRGATLQLEIKTPNPNIKVPSCSATLVAKNIILTAAHCFTKGLEYHVKEYDVQSGKSSSIELDKIVLHPKYKLVVDKAGNDQVVHDIAIARLARSPKNMVIAKLPAQGFKISSETTVISAGYGLNGRDVSVEDAMARPEVKAIQNEFKNKKNLTKKEQEDLVLKLMTILNEKPLLKGAMKASLVKDPHSSSSLMLLTGPSIVCKGDSGGPSFGRNTAELVVLGVHSWGKSENGECKSNHRSGLSGMFDSSFFPSFDTYVPLYADWIVQEMQKIQAEKSI